MFKKLMLIIVGSILVLVSGSIADEREDDQRQQPAFGAGWDSVTQITEGQKIELKTRDGVKLQGTLIHATAESIAIRYKSGERSIDRADVQRVRVYDAGRRTRRGVMWTAIGAGAGLGAGLAACPSCSNEGYSGYAVPGAIGGAALGALGFLSSPYKTIYEVK